MRGNDSGTATLSTVATFPQHFFLENIAVRGDRSILVTVLNERQLWCVPMDSGELAEGPVMPIPMYTFDDFAMGLTEAEPDVFYVATALRAKLYRFDLRGWRPGAPVTEPRIVLAFEEGDVALNGICMLNPRTVLAADCLNGLIWRIDLNDDGLTGTVRRWQGHATMEPDPDNGLTSVLGPQPGINGIRYAARTNVVYYTSSARGLFMRVPVTASTLEPAGPPEVVCAGIVADDFCLDEDSGIAYLTTHVQNTVVRVALEPSGQRPTVVAGEPLSELLVGPSSAVWGRAPGDYGRVAYVSTDGGHTAATYGRPGSDGISRVARVVRLTLEQAGDR